jgi:hypothetical protein
MSREMPCASSIADVITSPSPGADPVSTPPQRYLERIGCILARSTPVGRLFPGRLALVMDYVSPPPALYAIGSSSVLAYYELVPWDTSATSEWIPECVKFPAGCPLMDDQEETKVRLRAHQMEHGEIVSLPGYQSFVMGASLAGSETGELCCLHRYDAANKRWIPLRAIPLNSYAVGWWSTIQKGVLTTAAPRSQLLMVLEHARWVPGIAPIHCAEYDPCSGTMGEWTSIRDPLSMQHMTRQLTSTVAFLHGHALHFQTCSSPDAPPLCTRELVSMAEPAVSECPPTSATTSSSSSSAMSHGTGVHGPARSSARRFGEAKDVSLPPDGPGEYWFRLAKTFDLPHQQAVIFTSNLAGSEAGTWSLNMVTRTWTKQPWILPEQLPEFHVESGKETECIVQVISDTFHGMDYVCVLYVERTSTSPMDWKTKRGSGRVWWKDASHAWHRLPSPPPDTMTIVSV